MLAKRIIPCLDVDYSEGQARVVKGVKFFDHVDAGDPVEQAVFYDHAKADELVFYDITASHEGRGIMADVVRQVADRVFMPITVGGGIRTLDDATRLIQAGAEKVSINSAAVKRPELLAAVSRKFGRCATVVNIDPRRVQKPRLPERLAQSMDILMRPIKDLQEQIRRELQENPVVEEDKGATLQDEWWEVHINGGR